MVSRARGLDDQAIKGTHTRVRDKVRIWKGLETSKVHMAQDQEVIEDCSAHVIIYSMTRVTKLIWLRRWIGKVRKRRGPYIGERRGVGDDWKLWRDVKGWYVHVHSA